MTFIEPGGTIGVLGSGQLGRMFALAAKRLGYRIHVFSPESDTPAGQVADREVESPYEDFDAVADFVRGVDVITFEFENVPVDAVRVAEQHIPVRPGGHVLEVTQNRLREKRTLTEAGLPVPEFHAVHKPSDVSEANHFPAVLKTASCGYDGKGQAKLNSPAEFAPAWSALNCDEAILEEFVDFQCELSVIAARGQDGNFVCYAPILNHHRHHILDVSICPSGLPERVTQEAVEIAREVMCQLNVVGVLCVEFFLRPNGQLLINELAPRPHNSGHLTIDAHVTSQFDQQVRAVCGLPLGSTRLLQPAAMANILGDCWSKETPNWLRCIGGLNTHLHLYGKRAALPGRKMGHLTTLAENASVAADLAIAARQLLCGNDAETTPAQLQGHGGAN